MITTSVQNEKVTPVTFMSYNPTGLNSEAKCRFINKISYDYQVDFLSVQEHFKFTSNTNQYFKKQFLDYFSYIIPGYRSPGQDSGRAKFYNVPTLCFLRWDKSFDKIIYTVLRVRALAIKLWG